MTSLEEYQRQGLSLGAAFSLTEADERFKLDQRRTAKSGKKMQGSILNAS